MADVALLLEGVDPHGKDEGAVWLRSLIGSLPELDFAVVRVDGSGVPGPAPRPTAPLPFNVTWFASADLVEFSRRVHGASRDAFTDPLLLAERCLEHRLPYPAPLLRRVADLLAERVGLDAAAAPPGELWPRLRDAWARHRADPILIDTLWAVRAMHARLLGLVEVAAITPRARLLHTISVGPAGEGGYAALAGALLQAGWDVPLIVAEVHEPRRHHPPAADDDCAAGVDAYCPGLDGGAGFFRDVWRRFSLAMRQAGYAAADSILAPYESVRRRQLDDGAAPRRARTLGLGVEVTRLPSAPTAPPPILALPVHLDGDAPGSAASPVEVAAFVRAIARLAAAGLPAVEGWLLSSRPADRRVEDGLALADNLGVADRVRGVPAASLAAVLPQLGLLVLPEGADDAFEPLALTAMAGGVPLLAPDVAPQPGPQLGAQLAWTRRLVEGRDPADQSLGRAGALFASFDDHSLARAAVRLLGHPLRYRHACTAALRRVERYYSRHGLLEQHRALYRSALGDPAPMLHSLDALSR